jgi:hypothetical protein
MDSGTVPLDADTSDARHVTAIEQAWWDPVPVKEFDAFTVI